MFTHIQYGSSKADTPDVCNVQPDCAWVIDGCDPLFPTHITDASGDGEWLVRELNHYLRHHLPASKQPLMQIIDRALRTIHQKYLQFPGADERYDLEMPSASCAIVRIHEDTLSYFVLGICELKLQDAAEQIQTICDLRLPELDARLWEISRDLRQTQRMSVLRARDFVNNLMVENRLRRNMKGGYWVLGEDTGAALNALSGSVPLAQIRHVSLSCNSFAQYFNAPQVVHQLDRYLTHKRTMEFVELYNSLLAKKNKNEKLARYLLETIGGQSTTVFFDVDDPAKLNESASSPEVSS